MTSFGSFIQCYLLVMIVVGFCGNAYVTSRFLRFRRLRKQHATHYMLAISAADTGFLFIVAIQLLESCGLHFFYIPGWCKAYLSLGHLFPFLSAWYIIAFGLERCLVVYKPFYVAKLTKRYTHIVLLAVTLIGLVLNAWPALVIESKEPMIEQAQNANKLRAHGFRVFNDSGPEAYGIRANNTATNEMPCKRTSLFKLLYSAGMFLDAMTGFYIPCVCMVVLNVCIVLKLCREKKLRAQLGSGQLESQSRKRSYTTGSTFTAISKNSSFATLYGGTSNWLHFDCLKCCLPRQTDVSDSKTKNEVHLSERRNALTGASSEMAEILCVKERDLRRVRKRLRNIGNDSQTRDRGPTFVLLALAGIYMVLNLPIYSLRLYQWQKLDPDKVTDTELLCQDIFYLMFCTQFGINFMLYSYHSLKQSSKYQRQTRRRQIKHCGLLQYKMV